MNKNFSVLEGQKALLRSFFSRKKGKLLGSILLICGSSIGVGIMPLPILTGQAGALPTLAVFIACCIYMTITALLMLESSLLLANANFISIAKQSLNRFGQVAVLLSFLFLFYSLTTAYLAKGGELVVEVFQSLGAPSLPPSTGALFLSLLSGGFIFLGPFVVDYFNRIFMFGFFLTYLFLITSGSSYFHPSHLSHVDWSLSLFIIPFIITSFGYHNLVPSIANYLERDRQGAAKAFIYAGAILFFIYIIWVIGWIGMIPLKGEISLIDSFTKGEIVTQPLSRLIQWPAIQFSAQYMAIFAIVTSLLAQGLSVVDFLAETLKVEKNLRNRIFLCLLLFIPSLLFSQTIPQVFYKALELAGGVAAMVIFGIIPGILGWKNRYGKNRIEGFRPLVFGGKPMLIGVIAIASVVIGYEFGKNLF